MEGNKRKRGSAATQQPGQAKAKQGGQGKNRKRRKIKPSPPPRGKVVSLEALQQQQQQQQLKKKAGANKPQQKQQQQQQPKPAQQQSKQNTKKDKGKEKQNAPVGTVALGIPIAAESKIPVVKEIIDTVKSITAFKNPVCPTLVKRVERIPRSLLALEGIDAELVKSSQVSSLLRQLHGALRHTKSLASKEGPPQGKPRPPLPPQPKAPPKPHVPKINTPCAFWLKGSCNKANRCKFAHPADTPTTTTTTTPAETTEATTTPAETPEESVDESTVYAGQNAEQTESAINGLMVEIWQHAARKGHPEAQFLLGCVYAFGDSGVTKNSAKAIEWYAKAAKKGHAGAHFNLACCYAEEAGNEQKAVTWCQKAAALGDASAQCKLGEWHAGGEFGLPKDKQLAIAYFEKAAEQGNGTAMYQLALLYREEDEEEAKKDDEEEAEKEEDGEEKEDKSDMWLRKAAEAGEPNAVFEIGFGYLVDDQMRAEGVEMIRKAAEQGLSDAQFELGRCYHEGLGVTEDSQRAIELWTKAADQKNPEAMWMLGLVLEETGQATDEEALAWIEKSAEHDYPPAIYSLGFHHYEKKQFKAAFKLWRRAAKLGNPMANYNLGLIYQSGDILGEKIPDVSGPDLVQAKKYLEAAAMQGHEEAALVLEEINNPSAVKGLVTGGANEDEEEEEEEEEEGEQGGEEEEEMDEGEAEEMDEDMEDDEGLDGEEEEEEEEEVPVKAVKQQKQQGGKAKQQPQQPQQPQQQQQKGRGKGRGQQPQQKQQQQQQAPVKQKEEEAFKPKGTGKVSRILAAWQKKQNK